MAGALTSFFAICDSGQYGRRLSTEPAPSPTVTRSTFSEGRAEIVRHDGTITTTLEVAVSSEDDAEVRRVSITNLGNQARDIELTSYAEIVLAPPPPTTRIRHSPSCLSKRSLLPKLGAILATRRRRSPERTQVWAAHLAVVEGETVGGAQFETDRARFLGRGRESRTPIAVIDGAALQLRSAPCSIRSSVFAAVFGSQPGRPPASHSGRLSPFTRRSARSRRQASRCHGVRPRDHAGLDPGTSATPSPRHRRRTKRIFFSASPAVCSMPIRRCGRSPKCSYAAAAQSRCLGPSDLRGPADRPGPRR